MFYQDTGSAGFPVALSFTLASTEMPSAGLVPRDPSVPLAAASMLLHYAFSHSLAILLLFTQGC